MKVIQAKSQKGKRSNKNWEKVLKIRVAPSMGIQVAVSMVTMTLVSLASANGWYKVILWLVLWHQSNSKEGVIILLTAQTESVKEHNSCALNTNLTF